MTVINFPAGGRAGAGPEPETFDICGELPKPATTTLLEASAGTGKTWTIAALVTRLVAEGHGRLEEMLVVTFGRAASQELRERVRAQLVAAQRCLEACHRGHPPEQLDTLTELLSDVDPDELSRRVDRLREALTDFDAATIATTHQFCQLVLRSLGVAGDTDSASRLVESLDDLLIEVVDDLYVRGFARSDAEPIFNRKDALRLARAAVNDPQAHLVDPEVPDDVEPSRHAPYRKWRFACAVREEMDLRKRRLGVLSYDDLLSRLAHALQDDEAPARQRMRERWRYVLVDEFQDTDPVQWQVLDRAFTDHATMVLIGDPKQAIYAFRGGDVVTYLAAEATADVKRTLGTSYRSDQPLLESVQAVLRGAALGDERIVVRDVRAHHQDRRLEGSPRPEPFRLRMVDRQSFDVKPTKGVAIGRLRDLVADDLAADIRALLAAEPTYCGERLEARQVAVLCETRRQCELARDGLVRAGVQAVIAGSGSVYATEGADEWLCLLEAMEAPHRSDRVRAASLTSFFGHTAADLDARADDGGDALTERVSETLRDWAELMRSRGVAAVFETAVGAHGVPARVLQREGGERLLTDLRHVGESLHDESTRERLGLTALLVWMRGRMAEARSDLTGERTRRLDSDAAAVQILTIHGSKGLQFPVVYLPFVSDLYPRTPQVPLFHDEEGRRCLDVSGSDSPHAEAAVAEEAGEDLRLLYVAMTRAQSQLVAWWLPSAKNTTCAPLHRLLYGRQPGGVDVPREATVHADDRALEIAQHWQDAGGPHVETVQIAPPAGGTSGDGLGALDARTFDRDVDFDWRRTSYTALSAAADDQKVATFGSEPEATPKQDEPDVPEPRSAVEPGETPGVRSPMADLPMGATFGSLVHAVLEHTDPAADDLRAALLEQIALQRVRWPVDLDNEVLADALIAVLDTPMGPLVGDTTLREIGTKDRMPELDFELPLAGGDRRSSSSRPRLSELATILRENLEPGDPLLPYAETLDDPAYAEQVLAGYLTGSVDVVLRAGGKFVIVDYKSNWLGAPDEELTSHHYRPEALAEAMTHSSYPLQALLYAVVLHRFLRWRLQDYNPAEHLGGVMYLYLRGMCGPDTPVVEGERCGIFSWKPPVQLVEAVSDLLDGKS
jgi:exodeoxyribonuclease V beta subunit